MNRKQVKALHNGDEVFWNDPAEGTCSKYITIQSIWVGDGSDPIVKITGKDGSDLECWAHELS